MREEKTEQKYEKKTRKKFYRRGWIRVEELKENPTGEGSNKQKKHKNINS
jgi:hypothetical protein